MAQSQTTIYMDHAATTPVRPEVLAAMQPYFSTYYGNPSSIHGAGRKAHTGLEQARRTLAQLLGARSDEIIFTSCATESNNAALRGIALARRSRSGARRIITSPIEHKAVLQTAEDLAAHYGYELCLVPVDSAGLVEVAALEELLGQDTAAEVALVSLIAANNEVGTIQPIAEIAALCRARGVPLHTDAVQVAGRLPLSVDTLGVDALSLSAHKFYGPKGIGLLYLRRGTPFLPTMTGGSHEGSRRAGTENVPLIVGMAKALELAAAAQAQEQSRLQLLRDRLLEAVVARVEGAQITGHPHRRLANHASFVIRGVEAEGVLIALDLAGIAASSGSACTSAAQQPSHVLSALGIPPRLAAGALRLSLGRSTTAADVETVVDQLARIVARIRAALPSPIA